MQKITRKEIYLIHDHSQWSESDLNAALKDLVYPRKMDWLNFLRWFFLSLGLGFTVIGILFFFAYNWNDLHKFIKLSILLFLIVSVSILAWAPSIKQLTKQLLLTSVSMLVGGFFAVFGQIYQTGANAFDFFLAWLIFISIWVWLSRFVPLWLIYLLLINVTTTLYFEQVNDSWTDFQIVNLLIVLNTAALIFSLWNKSYFSPQHWSHWFSYIVAITIVFLTTSAIIASIYMEKNDYHKYITIGISSILYIAGMWYGWKYKQLIYLALIGLSMILIFSTILLKISGDEGMLFLICIFIISSITFLIKYLQTIQKSWRHGSK